MLVHVKFQKRILLMDISSHAQVIELYIILQLFKGDL